MLEHSRAPERMAADKVRCEACPVLCQISPGKLGACDRYGNVDGVLTRTDTLHLVGAARRRPRRLAGRRRPAAGTAAARAADAPVFVSGIGSGTTYPDYKPAPFIVASKHEGVDMVTVVTEGIFSYCSFKVKIDTDRYLGAGAGDGAAPGRGGRPRQHDRVRLAVPRARRRAPPDRRLEAGRPRSPAR